MRTVTCACGVVIPYRHVPDYYRLTPNAAEIRRQPALGVAGLPAQAVHGYGRGGDPPGPDDHPVSAPARLGRARLRYSAALSTHRLPGICLSAL